MNKPGWAALAFWFLTALLHAQNAPGADVSVQYSPLYILKGYTIWMNGVTASAERNVSNWLGFVGDVGFYRGHVPESLTGETYLVGPRFTDRRFGKVIPFAQDLFFQALFGGSHFSRSTGGITGGGSQFTFALGGGGDVGLGRTQRFALRPQLEYVGIRSGDSITPSVRISIGIVYRIGHD